MKIAVVTAISGLNNKLIDPKIKFNNVDYYAFVDKITPDSIWNQQKIHNFTLDKQYTGRRNAKIYKILPHLFLPEYDYYFWADSTHEVIMNPYSVVEDIINDSEIALFSHPYRNCVYDEAKELLSLETYDYPDLIKNQMKYYISEKYPKNKGLYELPCFIRKNAFSINTACLMWWEIICKYSSRDQISLPYVLFKNNITPCMLSGYANKGFYANDIIPQVRHKHY
jgi:hypothetical protein